MIRRIGIVLLMAGLVGSAVAQSQYAAKVTVSSGNSFVVKQLNIKGDRLYADSGDSSTSITMIKKIEFRFSGIGLNMCKNMFESGDRRTLESLLEQHVGAMTQFNHLPTNLDDYYIWWLKAQYWNGNLDGAMKTIAYIREMPDSAQVDASSLYFALVLLEQGKTEDAKTLFPSIGNPEVVSVPMVEYISGRLALETGDLRQAMQHVARIIAFYSRDAEWMPPATVLEAQIYQRLGQPQKAAAVATELMIAYPGTPWSKLGEQIKKETNGTLGD